MALLSVRNVTRRFGGIVASDDVSLVGARTRDDAHAALAYVGIGELARRRAAGLPFGTLKRVELARALATRPTLLLLDEPAGGLNHEEVAELGEFIRRLRDDFDLTV